MGAHVQRLCATLVRLPGCPAVLPRQSFHAPVAAPKVSVMRASSSSLLSLPTDRSSSGTEAEAAGRPRAVGGPLLVVLVVRLSPGRGLAPAPAGAPGRFRFLGASALGLLRAVPGRDPPADTPEAWREGGRGGAAAAAPPPPPGLLPPLPAATASCTISSIFFLRESSSFSMACQGVGREAGGGEERCRRSSAAAAAGWPVQQQQEPS